MVPVSGSIADPQAWRASTLRELLICPSTIRFSFQESGQSWAILREGVQGVSTPAEYALGSNASLRALRWFVRNRDHLAAATITFVSVMDLPSALTSPVALTVPPAFFAKSANVWFLMS